MQTISIWSDMVTFSKETDHGYKQIKAAIREILERMEARSRLQMGIQSSLAIVEPG
jgi:hypothetical protein